jgi:hypothetical protein
MDDVGEQATRARSALTVCKDLRVLDKDPEREDKSKRKINRHREAAGNTDSLRSSHLASIITGDRSRNDSLYRQQPGPTVYCMAVGRSFPFDRAGPTTEYFFSSWENGYFSSAEWPRNCLYFSFQEKFSRVSRRPFFIAFRAKNFQLCGPS